MSKTKRIQEQAAADEHEPTDETIEAMEELGEEQDGDEAITAPVAELVAAALDGNALKVQETFNLLVIDRIQALIEERKPLIADSLLNPEDIEEDADEDDEDVVEEDEDSEDEVVEEGDDKGHKYDKDAVNKEIKKDPRIKGKEAKAIHAVLKGRG